MRRRLTIHRTAAIVAGLVLVAAACSSTSSPGDTADPALVERTATVGAVEVKARPDRLDAAGAAFTITFDAHSGSLDGDPAAASALEVGGAQWPVAAWDGDPPSGHHRTGTLRFTPAGPATGTVTLTVGGLSEPATFSWSVGGS